MKVRQIQFKTLKETIEGREAPLDYRTQLRTIAESGDPRQGLSIADVRIANRIVEKLDDEKAKYAVLTGEEYNYLKARVEAFRWPFAAKMIEQFADDVLNAPEVDGILSAAPASAKKKTA